MLSTKEKNHIGIFFFVILISAIRIASEIYFLDYLFETSTYQILRFYLENLYYFLIAVFTVPALVSHFTREKYPSLLLLTAKLFPIIVLAPWADFFLTRRTTGYENAEVTPGILIQVTFIIGSVMAYVYLRTHNSFKAFIAGIGVYLMLWFFAMPEFVLPPLFDFSSDFFLQFYYFIPFFIGAIFFFRVHDQNSFEALIKNLRASKAVQAVIVALAGALTVHYSGHRLHEVHVLHVIALVFLLRCIPPAGLPLGASIVLVFTLLSFAFSLGLTAFFLSLAAVWLTHLGKLKVVPQAFQRGSLAVLAYLIAVQGSSYTPVPADLSLLLWGTFFFMGGILWKDKPNLS